jgi:N-acetylneuraminate synthase
MDAIEEVNVSEPIAWVALPGGAQASPSAGQDRLTLPPLDGAGPVGLPGFLAYAQGRPLGQFACRPVADPQALAGQAVELEIDAMGDAPAWLDAALQEMENRLRGATDVQTVFVRPTGAALAAALVRAGFAGPDGRGGYRKDLVAPYWRRNGVYVIAEAGSNWRMGSRPRDMEMAKSLIDVAVEAGADAVKFQTFRADTVYVAEAGASDYLADAGIRQNITEIFEDLAMPYDMLPVLAEYAKTCGIDFMSTPFSADDFRAVDPYVAVHKVASYEISHVRLIELAARSNKPTLMSTGAATLDDIAWAIDVFHRNGGRDLCLMQCTAKYPAPLSSLNLATIPEMARRFGVSVGLSDHSREAVAGPLAAVALGARAIEKHFTLDNRLPGPDHRFALTPAELKDMVRAVREASEARGSAIKSVGAAEAELLAFAQRGIQAIMPIAPGDLLQEDRNIAILRPGKQTKGVHPRHMDAINGRKAARALKSGEGLREGDWQE